MCVFELRTLKKDPLSDCGTGVGTKEETEDVWSGGCCVESAGEGRSESELLLMLFCGDTSSCGDVSETGLKFFIPGTEDWYPVGTWK